MKRTVVMLGLLAPGMAASAQSGGEGPIRHPSRDDPGLELIVTTVIIGLMALEAYIYGRSARLSPARAWVTVLISDGAALTACYAALPLMVMAKRAHLPTDPWDLLGFSVLAVVMRVAVAAVVNPRSPGRLRLLATAALTTGITLLIALGAIMLYVASDWLS